MKKLLLLIFCAFLLVGCKDTGGVTVNTKNLAFTVESDFKNTAYLFSATTDSEGRLALTVNEPESIENFKLFFNDDSVRLNYLELENEIPLKSLEENSVFMILYEGFKDFSSPQFRENEFFTEFNVGNEKYEFYFAESGLPLYIKGDDAVIYFKGVRILNDS